MPVPELSGFWMELLTTRRKTNHTKWKGMIQTDTENGEFSYVLFCLRSVLPLERCEVINDAKKAWSFWLKDSFSNSEARLFYETHALTVFSCLGWRIFHIKHCQNNLIEIGKPTIYSVTTPIVSPKLWHFFLNSKGNEICYPFLKWSFAHILVRIFFVIFMRKNSKGMVDAPKYIRFGLKSKNQCTRSHVWHNSGETDDSYIHLIKRNFH